MKTDAEPTDDEKKEKTFEYRSYGKGELANCCFYEKKDILPFCWYNKSTTTERRINGLHRTRRD